MKNIIAIIVVITIFMFVFLLPGCNSSSPPSNTTTSRQNFEMTGSLKITNSTYLVVLNIIPTTNPGFVMLDNTQRASIVDNLVEQLQQNGLSPKETLTAVVPKDFINTKVVQLADFMLEAPLSFTGYPESVEDLGVPGIILNISQTISGQVIPNPPEIVAAFINEEMTAISQAGSNSIKSVSLSNGQSYTPSYIAGNLGQEITVVVQIMPPTVGQSFSLNIPGTIAFSPDTTEEIEIQGGHTNASLESGIAKFSIAFGTNSSLIPTSTALAHIGSLHIVSGSGIFSSISATNTTIPSKPGQELTGTITIQADNLMPNWAVAPLIGTPSWGDHSMSWWLINKWIPTGNSIQTANVNLAVPTTPGSYYIFFAFSGEMDGDEVASVTNWSSNKVVWNDGNDIADFTANQIDKAQQNGEVIASYLMANGYELYYVPACAVKIIVSS